MSRSNAFGLLTAIAAVGFLVLGQVRVGATSPSCGSSCPDTYSCNGPTNVTTIDYICGAHQHQVCPDTGAFCQTDGFICDVQPYSWDCPCVDSGGGGSSYTCF